ncbi:MAG: Lipopolysaccharide assembly protein B [Chroococcopsis gigantea SAG 12.99]|nr:Lipopolysaccharide assembly protein B [Chroococcopsis gigantea SAG 12.99]
MGLMTTLTAYILVSCRSTPVTTTEPVKISPSVSTIKPDTVDVKGANKYRQLGLEYRQKGKFKESIAALQKSVALDPGNLSGQVILGWTQHLAQQHGEAAKTLENTLKQDPDYVPALNALGIVYLVQGKLNQAVTTHTKAQKLKPDNEIAYYNLALAYHRLRDFPKALTNAEKAIALEPGNPHPLVAKAMIQWDGGDRAGAKRNYSRALRLDPRYAQAWFLAHLLEAAFSEKQIETVEKIRKF